MAGLGDHRFEQRQGKHGGYLLPPLIAIEGGTYIIGDDSSQEGDEKPAHPVELDTFRIGKYPVTNAEYKLFVDAGGYDDEQWWETDAAKAWRRGEGQVEGMKQRAREMRDWYANDVGRRGTASTWMDFAGDR